MAAALQDLAGLEAAGARIEVPEASESQTEADAPDQVTEPAESRSAPSPGNKPELTLAERIIDALVDEPEGSRGELLAPKLGVDTPTLRAELMELEQLRMVYRTGRTRGTRWHLG